LAEKALAATPAPSVQASDQEAQNLETALALMDARWGGYQTAKDIIRRHCTQPKASAPSAVAGDETDLLKKFVHAVHLMMDNSEELDGNVHQVDTDEFMAVSGLLDELHEHIPEGVCACPCAGVKPIIATALREAELRERERIAAWCDDVGLEWDADDGSCPLGEVIRYATLDAKEGSGGAANG
jgi:hypothetical protein